MASQGLGKLITLLNSSVLNGAYKTLPSGNFSMQSARSLVHVNNKLHNEPSRNEREQGDTKGNVLEVNEQTKLPQQQFRGENSVADGGTGALHINNVTRQVLIDEFSNIYAQYKSNKNLDEILKQELDPEIPESLRTSVNKAKEMYINSLKASQSPSTGPCSGRAPGSRSHLHFLGTQTVYGDMFREFSTSPFLGAKKKNECDKAKKLPCLEATELSDKREEFGKKQVCERFCMPCCKPARDPPTCTFPYQKPPCEKMKPPRPSFSECKKIFPLKRIEPCECVRPLAGSCKKSQDTSACQKG